MMIGVVYYPSFQQIDSDLQSFNTFVSQITVGLFRQSVARDLLALGQCERYGSERRAEPLSSQH
jgi:hypothetical protein